MPLAESVNAWSAVLKTFFVSAMLEKARRPNAPRYVWVFDGAGQLGAFPLVVKLFTLSAGLSITPAGVFQAFEQMNNLGPNGRSILTSSPGLQISFAARDIDEAARVFSKMLGVQRLHKNDALSSA